MIGACQQGMGLHVPLHFFLGLPSGLSLLMSDTCYPNYLSSHGQLPCYVHKHYFLIVIRDFLTRGGEVVDC